VPDNLESILFLAILVLFPIAFIAMIVALIVRNVRKQRGFAALAKNNGWKQLGRDSQEMENLRSMLEATFFTARDGRHSLPSGLEGEREGARFWIADYHYSSGHTRGKHRVGVRNTVLVARIDNGLDGFFVLHRQSGALARAAERFAASMARVPDDPAWSWALLPAGFDADTRGFDVEKNRMLRELLEPGDGIFFYEQLVVLVRARERDLTWAARAPQLVDEVARFLVA